MSSVRYLSEYNGSHDFEFEIIQPKTVSKQQDLNNSKNYGTYVGIMKVT